MSACIRGTLVVLPWVLLAASATVGALGLSWRQLTEDDTVNGTLLIVSIVLAALAFLFLCVREMPQKKETHAAAAPVPGARLPLVSAA
tara:strand:+ start:142 stop:405 length:264 start_codon:yes stop_codon:yes gene_type:complete